MKSSLLACTFAFCLFAGPAAARTPAPPPSAPTAAPATRDLADLAAAIERGLRPSVVAAGEAVPRWTLQQRMAHHKVPGVAIALVQDGQPVYAVGYGVRAAGSAEAIDADTLFSVGSVSKMITAATTLRLVAQGRLDLDRDVGGYLKSWRIPPAPAIADPRVTLRMLLSHTSGLNVHGFEDYQPGEALPTLLQTLDGKPPAKNPPIRLQYPPGTRMDYSGGGIMVEQQIVEDVAGQPLEAVARAQVFEPAGMRRSSFDNPLPASRGNIAHAHDRNGARTALPRGWESFPEQGASGLWTSARDLGGFVAALLRSRRGDGLLPPALFAEMTTAVSPGRRGLGPELAGAGVARRFFHNGSNDSYHAGIEGYPQTGFGFVILTNGANGSALRGEIRNAISDALGDGVKPPIRTVAADAAAPGWADYAGTYRLDPAVPMDVRGALADWFDYDALTIETAADALLLRLPDEADAKLRALGPTRFLGAGAANSAELEFHRDAHGAVRALSVIAGDAHAYYRRQPAQPARADGRAATP
ncbi:serine hydrolase domain-containing protein [Lysobacter yananisis]|uniref:Serine hydrolase domain-containing protein n=1 Tax=Lysobacter yananisis TaxID=1003114 RepID=A0ABY9P4Q4_9GAMM|nr:serine hydrolase domain-containing protein [Lysobacter yananisis]WMT01954.1 serine hydrolase domain-containing protein [Lysobacter yananisis]